MSKQAVRPTGKERFFERGEIIVSKTDTKGRISYANDIFLKIAGYKEAEVLGQPHSLIRHPDMPRCVFKLLWDRIQAGEEIFAYVVNLAKNGDHYWVLAHVTPSYGPDGRVVGYHSNRRVPARDALKTIEPLYKQLCAEEKRHANAKEGMAAAGEMLNKAIADSGMSYDELIFSLEGDQSTGVKGAAA